MVDDADPGTPILYRDAGCELRKFSDIARRAALKRVHSSPSWRGGIVTSSPWSNPTSAALTTSSADDRWGQVLMRLASDLPKVGRDGPRQHCLDANALIGEFVLQ